MSFPPKQPARASLAPNEQSMWDDVIERARKQAPTRDVDTDAGYYGRLLQSPPASYHLSELGRFFRGVGDRPGSYSHHDREVVDQVFAADWKTNCVAITHINDALAVGVRMELIEALRYGREHELTEDEAGLVSFIRKVVTGKMDKATWDRIETRMGERGVVEYACFILFLQTTMRGIQLMSGGVEPSDAEIDQMIADLKSGKREVLDYRRMMN